MIVSFWLWCIKCNEELVGNQISALDGYLLLLNCTQMTKLHTLQQFFWTLNFSVVVHIRCCIISSGLKSCVKMHAKWCPSKIPGNRISWSISKGLGLCISHTGLDCNDNTQHKVTIRFNLKLAKAHWKQLYKVEMIANCKLLHWNEQLIVPAQLPLQLIWSHINVIYIKFWYHINVISSFGISDITEN